MRELELYDLASAFAGLMTIAFAARLVYRWLSKGQPLSWPKLARVIVLAGITASLHLRDVLWALLAAVLIFSLDDGDPPTDNSPLSVNESEGRN